MSTKLFFLLYGLCVCITGQSQQISSSVIASAGGNNNAVGISLDWTLGETAVESIYTTDRLYTQGFHQPILIAKSFTIQTENWTKDYRIELAPNPVQSNLYVCINSTAGEKSFLTLVDIVGRRYTTQVATGKISNTIVDMSGLFPGVYLLEVRNAESRLIKTFKIIKGQ